MNSPPHLCGGLPLLRPFAAFSPPVGSATTAGARAEWEHAACVHGENREAPTPGEQAARACRAC
jgi:hypothetical protein